MMNNETIAAIATPAGHGGIGIIRISGLDALTIAQQLFRPRSSTPAQAGPVSFNNHASFSPAPYRLYYGYVIDPQNGQVIDETLIAYMPGPRSYTREDVIELQVHSGPAVLQRLLQIITALGARLAEPGEFTRRAFLNGRIDLTQAEAVIDLIQATSDAALNAAVSQLSGRLRNLIEPIITQINDMRAAIEAGIEFSDETGLTWDRENFRDQILRAVLGPLQRLADSYQYGQVLRDGFRLAIVGRPNVGKSSLLNAMILQERAIVTDTPGTTRDTIEAPFYIKGLPVIAVDTAGLRSSEDPVERIGIQKAREALQTADLVLLVMEAGVPFGPDDSTILKEIDRKTRLMVINKIDLVDHLQSPGLPQEIDVASVVRVSALTGEGIVELKEKIADHCAVNDDMGAQDQIVTNQRHKSCLDKAMVSLQRALDAAKSGLPEDIVSMDLLEATDVLNQLMGHGLDSDLLDTIFQRFCIGK